MVPLGIFYVPSDGWAADQAEWKPSAVTVINVDLSTLFDPSENVVFLPTF